MREWLSQYVPTAALDFVITIIVIIGAILFVTQNTKILRFLGRLVNGVARFFSKIFGRRIKTWNTTVLRSAYLNKNTLQYKYVKIMEELLLNLDLHRDGVSVTGLTLFMVVSSLLITLVINSFMSFGWLLALVFVAVYIVIFILFRLVSLTQLEKREEMIMDAIDFIVSDIKGGVFNAMMRYENSFNPAIRPYFSECIDDIKNKGASFESAMLKLNGQLGNTFTDFAYKAIIYEAKADDGLEDLFSSIIETNRNRRNLRYINNQEFNALKIEFLLSLGIILAYVVLFGLSDPFTLHFLTQEVMGRVMIIADVIIIAAVLAFITQIKAKSL